MTVQWGNNRVEKLTPPGVADERTRFMLEAIAAVMLEEDISTCVIGWDNAPVEMLPAMIVENSLQEFIEPGLPEARIRDIGKQAFYLHSIKGFDFGVLYALAAFGLNAEILQWYLREPPGPPNTHRVMVDTQQDVFDDGGIWADRTFRQFGRIIDNMKRWSQDTAVTLVADPEFQIFAATSPATQLTVTAHPKLFDPPVVTNTMQAAVQPLTRLSVRVFPFFVQPPVASGQMRAAVEPLTRLSIIAHAQAA